MIEAYSSQMPYTPAAEKKLKHLFNLLGTRIIPGYFLQANPEKFQQWHYNACNQTALITAYILGLLLEAPGKNESNPFWQQYFDIQLYEGIFTEDHMPGSYNHAYLFARAAEKSEPRTEEEHRLADEQAMCFFIDVGRVSNPTVFAMGYGLSFLPVTYSNNYQLHSTKQLDLPAMLTRQPEYYTGKIGLEICRDIVQILTKLGFNLAQFDWKA